MKLVTIFESTNRLDAEMAEGLLKDSQIPALLQCDDGAGLFPGIESYFGCKSWLGRRMRRRPGKFWKVPIPRAKGTYTSIPMSRRYPMPSNFTPSMALYACSLAWFKSAPQADTERTRPPEVRRTPPRWHRSPWRRTGRRRPSSPRRQKAGLAPIRRSGE